MIQNEPLHDFDYVWKTVKGKRLNVEMRCRSINWGQYPTIFIKAGKLALAMRDYRINKKFIFIVRVRDGVYAFAPSRKNIHKLRNSWGGRLDRNDPKDMEWIVEIPIKLFRKI